MLKIFFFPRTTGPIATKHGAKHPWIMGILVYLSERPHPSPKGNNSKMYHYIKNTLKPSSPEPQGYFHSNLTQTSLDERDSILFK